MRVTAFNTGEKAFVLSSLERASSEGVFEALEAVYSRVPPSTCRRQAFCCWESPRIYFVEFLNLYRALMERPRQEQAAIQERCVRYAFLDLCDPNASCPLLEGNDCLLYGSRGLRCRLWGHESQKRYDEQIAAAKKHMAWFSRLMDHCGLNIPVEILAYQPPYCQVTVLDSAPLTDEEVSLSEERLQSLERRFLGSADPDERYVDLARHLYTTLFGLQGYGALRVRVMREYLECSTEKALEPFLERARSLALAHSETSRPKIS